MTAHAERPPTSVRTRVAASSPSAPMAPVTEAERTPDQGTRDLRPALRRILKNAGSILIGDAGGEILTAYAIGLAALKLGRAGFGTLSEAQAFIEPFEALAGFGLRQVAITVAARQNGCDGKLRGTMMGLQVVLALISFSFAATLAVTTGRGSLMGLITALGVAMVGAQFSAVAVLPFHFEQSMHRLMVVPFLGSVVRLATTYLAVYLYNAPLGYQLSGLAASLFTMALSFRFMRRYYPTKLEFDWTLGKKLLLLAWPAAALEFVIMAYVRGSYFLLHHAGAAIQGEYAAADRLVRPVLGLAGALFVSSLPTVAVLAAEHDYETLRRVYGKSIIRVVQIGVPLLAVAWLLACWLLRRFVPEYAGAILPFSILTVGAAFMFVNQLSTTFIVALGKFRVIMTVCIVNLGVYVLLATRLIPRFAASGAAAATTLMEALNTCMQVVIVFYLLRTAMKERASSTKSST